MTNTILKYAGGGKLTNNGFKPLLLVVDDNVSSARVLYETFKDTYEVCIATNGKDALEFCEDRVPDIVLLDIVMPGFSGYEVCRRLKSASHTRMVPIIFVTGQNNNDEEARALLEGGVDFITKPFHTTVVKARVNTHVTIKRQADELRLQKLELEKSHAELRGIQDSTPLGLFHMGNDGKFSYVNKKFEEITGSSRDSAMRYGWKNLIHPDDLQLVQEHWAALSENGVRYDLIHRLSNIENGTRYVHVLTAPVVVAGAVIGFVGTVDDITERLHATQQAQSTQKRLELITDSVPAVIGYIDHEERYRFCNKNYQDILGFEREKILGMQVQDVFGELVYESLAPHIKNALSGERVSFEIVSMRRGKPQYLQCAYVPDVDENMVVQGFYALITDITDYHENQQLLSDNEKKLRMITDNVPALITYIDQEHCVQFANATMHEWTGKDSANVVGMHFADVLNPELYAERLENLERALSGERIEFEMTVNAFGQKRYLHSTYIPDIGRDDKVKGIYTFSNDITKLKLIEHELRKLARIDSLTGLPNRPHLYEILDVALGRAKRRKMAIAVFFLDIDNFKSINDTMGHAAGDTVLQEFSLRLKQAVRLTDSVARLAGDEFVIILEDLKDPKDVQAIAEKVLEATRRPIAVQGQLLNITTSIGVVYDHSLTENGVFLLTIADEALYEAKRSGRNKSFLKLH